MASYNGPDRTGEYVTKAAISGGTSALTGLVTGAQIGTAGGPIGIVGGTIIGALVGLGSSALSSYFEDSAMNDQYNSAIEAQEDAIEEQRDNDKFSDGINQQRSDMNKLAIREQQDTARDQIKEAKAMDSTQSLNGLMQRNSANAVAGKINKNVSRLGLRS